jgi:hypothetical protein
MAISVAGYAARRGVREKQYKEERANQVAGPSNPRSYVRACHSEVGKPMKYGPR